MEYTFSGFIADFEILRFGIAGRDPMHIWLNIASQRCLILGQLGACELNVHFGCLDSDELVSRGIFDSLRSGLSLSALSGWL